MTHTHASRPLAIALTTTAAVTAVEVAGAWLFNSLALAADAAHMFADVVALAIAVIAQRLAHRPASGTHSFGWRRAEVLAAEINAFLLLLASLFVLVEAVRRWQSPSDVQAGGVIAVASVGLVVNLVNTAVLHRSAHDNMNVRAAALHTLGDAAGSLAAIVAGVIIAAGGSLRSDAFASLVIASLVVWAALRLLGDTIHVLLEATPAHLNAHEVLSSLEDDLAVIAVHDLHVWTVAPGAVALSAHVELAGEISLHQAQTESIRLKSILADRFAITHSTLELECHSCPDDAAF